MVALPTAELRGLDIVLVGDLNPAIFQPAWFAAQKLIGESDRDGAKIEIIHSDVAIFSLDWLRVVVERERMTVSTTQEPYERLRDFVWGTFRLLRHTPIRMMGINSAMHFPMPSEAELHALGDRLAPKDAWTFFKQPRLRTLIMEQNPRPDDEAGYVRVKIEPSVRVPMGVYLQINEHFEVKQGTEVIGCDLMMKILETRWAEVQLRVGSVIESVFGGRS